jgi:prepilin-type N-terminal cleavage/methylation domain-containing protein
MKKGSSAFTLVELLLASTIFAVVAVSIFSAFRSGYFGYTSIAENIQTYQSLRFIFNRLSLDLRNAFIYTQEEGRFRGEKDSLSFYSLVDSFAEDRLVEDYCRITYELKEKKLMRLCRKNAESIGDVSDVLPEELPAELEDLTFSYGYFDQAKNTLEWKDAWNSGTNPLPEEAKTLPVEIKVKITLKTMPGEEFTRTIFLPLGGKGP